MNILHLAILVIASVAVFFTTLFNTFVWDDHVILLGKEIYRNGDLLRIFTTPANGLEFLPLRDITYVIDFKIWGENAFGFHITQLVLYAANIIAVYWVALLLAPVLVPSVVETGKGALWALLAALLFSVHPLHVEPVAFVMARNVVLSGIFFFLSIGCYCRYMEGYRKNWNYSLALAFFVAAGLSKATTIILPLMLLTILVLHPLKRKKDFLLLLPFFAVGGGFFLLHRTVALTSGMMNPSIIRFGSGNLFSRFATAIEMPFFYIQKFLLPFGLSVEYHPSFSTSFRDAKSVGALIVLAAVATAVLLSRKKYPWAFFGLLSYLAMLLPVLNLFPTHPVVADRYMYLPLFGLCVMTAAILVRLHSISRFASMGCAMIVIVSWGILTMGNIKVWRDDVSLFSHAIASDRQATQARINLASVLFDRKDWERAQKVLLELQAVDPSSPYLDYYQGLRRYHDGDYAESLLSFRRAIMLNESFIGALFFAGNAYERLGQWTEAAAMYARVAISHEADASARKPAAAERLRRLQAASGNELASLRGKAGKGDADALAELAVSAERLGLWDEAENAYRQLSKTMPSWQVYFNLGNVLKKKGNFEAAEASYRQSALLNPGYADTWNNIGAVLKERQRYKDATVAFQKALEVNPRFAFAWFNLGDTYFRLGDGAAAEDSFRKAAAANPALAPKVNAYLNRLGK